MSRWRCRCTDAAQQPGRPQAQVGDFGAACPSSGASGCLFLDSTELAAYGAEYIQGLRYGLAYATQGKGTVNGRKIELNIMDDGSDPNQSVIHFNNQDTQPHNIAIFEMAEFQDHLYAGTGNLNGFQVWKTDATGTPPYRWQQVDRIATPVTEAPVEYPAMLRQQQVEGRVVAEFVVDTLGRVEPKSVRIVSATHALFANAARAALPRARYTPAELEGRKVRQLVVLPVRFTQPVRGR